MVNMPKTEIDLVVEYNNLLLVQLPVVYHYMHHVGNWVLPQKLGIHRD